MQKGLLIFFGTLLAVSSLAARAQQNAPATCGWIGVYVRPMTLAFAQSLGMSQVYGAIFDIPSPGSPAAVSQIESGDVLTSINGTPLRSSADFGGIISRMAPAPR